MQHSASEYVRKMVHMNSMESFWSLHQRGCLGDYHKMSPKPLGRYVTEFRGRHTTSAQPTRAARWSAWLKA